MAGPLALDYPPPANRPEGVVPRPISLPTLEAVRGWVNVPETTMDDDQLTAVVLTEATTQLSTCFLRGDENALPVELVQALYRRVSRQVAARNLPLGLTDNVGEYGPARIPAYDAEIMRLEAPRKIPAVA